MLDMMNNNAFFRIGLGITIIGYLTLLGCAETQVKDTEPPKQQSEEIARTSNNEHVERVIRKLKPHLNFVEDTFLEEMISGYRKIYLNVLNHSTDQSLNERLVAIEDMANESIQALDSKAKDVKGKKCVVERDFLSAEIMPLVGEIEIMYKRHLNKVPLATNEISDLKIKVKTLNDLDSRLKSLCKPYKDTLRLLNNEARMDANYILNGGSAPGKAVPDQESEVDELIKDGESLD